MTSPRLLSLVNAFLS